uniref:Uncharacterized protein n=1 Tax=Fagus sylvatica TaxID=28930 RepID=A0A2N9FJI8_FAGSY
MGRKKKVKGGKLSRFVNTPEAMAVFRQVYEIPDDVGLKYVHWSDALVPASGDLLLPVVAIVEGGIRFPLDPLMADFLSHLRLSPSQVNPNVFRIVMGTAVLNRRLGLELGIHDILRTYILHHNTKTDAYSLRPRDVDFTLVNGLPDTNRGFDEDYLIVSGEWFLSGHKCPTKDGAPDPRRRNPRKSLINIDSLREVWESEICTDDDAQPRSAPLLLRYVVQTKSFLACRLVKDIQAARANPANLALPPVDIRKVLDEDAPVMAGINLRNLLPTRSREGTSETVPVQSTPARSKRARVESSAGLSRPTTFHPARSAGEGSTRLWAPRMEYRGADPVAETDCILPVGVDRSATVASALSQAVRLPLDMEEWRKATDDELISNLRRGLLMGVQASLELEDRFRTNKEHLAHANVLATKYQDAKKTAAEAQSLAEAANSKRVEAEESLSEALDSLTKAEDKVRALELELERAKKEAYERGSQEAQDEMGRQLPGMCNLYYTDAWEDALAVLNSGQTTLPPTPLKLPFPGAVPPPSPEAVLNSPLPQLGDVVDLEEVESAEAAGPAHEEPQDAPDGSGAAPEDVGPSNS